MKRYSLVLLVSAACLALLPAQTAEEKKATVAFLQTFQTKQGGFFAAKTSTPAEPTLRSTSTALRGLKYFGGEPTNAKGAAEFVAKHFDKASGGFVDTPGSKPDVFTTALGLMAVVQLKLPLEPYVEPAVKFMLENAKNFEEIRIAAAGLETVGKQPPQGSAFLDLVTKMKNDDGTYGKGKGQARDTGSAAAAVLRLGGKLDQPNNVLKALQTGQRADGGYGKADADNSDLETTYRVMRAFHMLKAKPDDAKLRTFLAKCRNADGGYGVAPGQPSTVSATYFAGIIYYWLDQK